MPLLRRGGWLIAQKGRDPQEELAGAQRALRILGGRLHSTLPVAVPGLDADRTLVMVAKVASTPLHYPRRPGVPERLPIA